MNRLVTIAAVPILSAALLGSGGCNANGEEQQQEPVRLVRTLTVRATPAVQQLTFAGAVQARFDALVGFRVGGKIIERRVDVGSRVERGQVLARLDAQDLRLAVDALAAELDSARTSLKLAQLDYERYDDLRAKRVASQADYDRAQTAVQAAQERVEAAAAQLAQARNQVKYADLVADYAGVITALEAEAGQVVAAGQPVLRLARLDEREIVISVPEQHIERVHSAPAIEVSLWADPDKRYRGKVREIAPSTDPATRTFLVKIAVLDADEALRLGMSAEVTIRQPAASALMLPLSALHTKTDRPNVWLVDTATATVNPTPVETGGLYDNQVIIKAGVKPGDVVVTAGANLLIPGQRVRLAEAGL
jgi:RND family efflux transporter MFP subunit